MRKRVKLMSHDRSKNYLVFDKFDSRFGHGIYIFKLVTEFPTVRIIGSPNNPEAIDPSGGPMLSRGDTTIIPGFVLDRIDFSKEGFRLYFKSIRNGSPRR